MAIPEAVAIFTTLTGILNLLRTTYRSLQQDAVEWRNYIDWNETRAGELRGLKDAVEDWQERWMVWTKDESLCDLFWGSKSRYIRQELDKLLCQMKKFGELLDKSDLTKMSKWRGRFRQALDTILINRGQQHERALANLKSRFDVLSSTSNSAFLSRPDRRNPLDPSPALPTSRIHQLGLSRLIVELALATYDASDDLHDRALRSHKGLGMELELNMFGPDLGAHDRLPRQNDKPLADATDHIVSRSEGIAISAADSAIHYTFLVKDLDRRRELWLRIRTTPDPNLKASSCRHTFEDAVQFITDGNPKHQICGLVLSNNRRNVVVRVEFGNIEGNIPDSTPLRDILRTVPPENHTAFATVKAKRALQVAEFGLLFFKTTWIQSICSCNIRQVEVAITGSDASPDDRYRLTLKRLTLDSRDIAEASLRSPSCWCKAKRDDEDDGIESREVGQPPRILLTYSSTLDTTTQTFEDMRETLDRHGAGFYNAIKFCIEIGWTTNDAHKENLIKYYWQVIVPLYGMYNDLQNERRDQI